MRASSSSSSSLSSTSVLLGALLVLALIPAHVSSQGCASTCPPLDDTGRPIPSLCVDDIVPSAYLDKLYGVCHPVVPVPSAGSSSNAATSDEEGGSDSGTAPANFRLSDYHDRIVVLANHYVGCNAGRRESGVFAHVAQRYTALYGPSRVTFITSLKGGSSCERWADIYQSDARTLFPESEAAAVSVSVSTTDGGAAESPWTVSDVDYRLRDDFFTTPFGHPSYVILAPLTRSAGGAGSGGGGEMVVRHKFVGPCCGYVKYSDCLPDTARELDGTLGAALDGLLEEMGAEERESITASANTTATSTAPNDESPVETTQSTAPPPEDCVLGEWYEWSPCSFDCNAGDDSKGVQFRYRTVQDNRRRSVGGDAGGSATTVTEEGETVLIDGESLIACPSPVETRSCPAESDAAASSSPEISVTVSATRSSSETTSCSPACISEFGSVGDSPPNIYVVADGFSSPRDVAFHPTPGLHLRSRSSGRDFHPTMGEEAWVANGGNHSVSVVASLGFGKLQTTIARRDRGYYHYMVNVTALSFNTIPPSVSGRDGEKETFNYFALCNDNRNDYMGTKEPNYFMGPTLYDTDPSATKRNLVTRLGEPCATSDEECYLLHSDMLHESPSCIGLAHDPEIETAYGTVYWAFDSDGDRDTGQLVRFDFQQPHGPGSMDHSVAAVRRYPEIKLERGESGVHAGMIVHPSRRELFVANPGSGTILVVKADSGAFSRTARTEYPIYSNQLPSFEYSIWECVDHAVFADGLDTPTGLALSPDGDRLFVAERGTGNIIAYDVESGVKVGSVNTGYESINGMAFSPQTEVLHFVDAETDSLVAVKPSGSCETEYQPLLTEGYKQALMQATDTLGPTFSPTRNYACLVNPIPPNASLFDQVHLDTGYASDDPNVQSTMVGMDEAAALLANRTDCGYDSELNFDALLLGGYYCHTCLPGDHEGNNGAMCDAGGACRNVLWRGYVCDNHYVIKADDSTGKVSFYEPDGREPLNPQDMSLRWGVTYRFTVMTSTQSVSIHATDEERAPALALPVQDGPLLVAIDEQLMESKHVSNSFDGKLYFRSSSSFDDSVVVSLAVEDVPGEHYPNADGNGHANGGGDGHNAGGGGEGSGGVADAGGAAQSASSAGGMSSSLAGFAFGRRHVFVCFAASLLFTF